jgi:hypothetical protein
MIDAKWRHQHISHAARGSRGLFLRTFWCPEFDAMIVYVVFGRACAGIDDYVAPSAIAIATIKSLRIFAQFHFLEGVKYTLSIFDFMPPNNILRLKTY